MCSCDQSLVTLAFLWEELSQPQFYKDLTWKTTFFEGWSWFKFNNLGIAPGKNLKFYTSVAKGLKLKVRKFWRLIPTFVKVTGEKLVEGSSCPLSQSWIGLIPWKIKETRHSWKNSNRINKITYMLYEIWIPNWQ